MVCHPQLFFRSSSSIAHADGANDDKRIAQLAVTGDSEYETFDLYFPIFFPMKSAGYELLVRKPGRGLEVTLLDPLSR